MRCTKVSAIAPDNVGIDVNVIFEDSFSCLIQILENQY